MSHLPGDPGHSLESLIPETGGRHQAAPPPLHAPDPGPEREEDETLFLNEETRIFRRKRPRAGSMICKEFLGARALPRLRHETRILERLQGLDGIPRLVSYPLPGTLAVEDFGAGTLAETLPPGQIEVPLLLELALQLAAILSRLHRAGVAHRNLSPGKIVCAFAPLRVMLVDYSLATTFADDRPPFLHHREIAGELPYLSPEQTGRTGWPVDHRADLYALGATLYHLVTGAAPFTESDPLQLIHDILARVPSPPDQINPQLPRGLSRIIMRLLEKEPDRRYQSGEGLVWDLKRLADALARGSEEVFPLGRRDFPLRLSPPSRLIGRSREIAALREAFGGACRGEVRGVLVAGGPGVGKSALINELRPVVTARRGFFAAGKFDQHRQDVASDAVVQALAALAALLLAEPEEEMAAIREEILHAVGPNAALAAAMNRGFALLLGTAPALLEGDQRTDRLIQTGLDLLRGIASPARPVVLVLDDLQWASPTACAFVAGLLSCTIPGLLLVGSYRDGEVKTGHPLWRLLGCRDGLDAPLVLELDNLAPPEIGQLLQEMLRLDGEDSAALAAAAAASTGGNPFDTVELVNALRREGMLVPTETGWRWDGAAVRGHLGTGNVVDLLGHRIERLPAGARELLDIMACLGGKLSLPLLQCASGLSPYHLEEESAPLLEDGLLVAGHAPQGSLRFRHDRVQQAAYGRLAPGARDALHLVLARRLSERGFETAAAEQYLPVCQSITDPAERRVAASLFRDAAARCRLINNGLSERLLAAAVTLLEANGDVACDPLLLGILCERHAALYTIGSLDEADRVYALIEGASLTTMDLADAACVQMSSLMNRGRTLESVELGLAMLRQLGLEVPQGDELEVRIATGLGDFYRWVEQDDRQRDLERAEMSDPQPMAIAKVVNRILPGAFFTDRALLSWLVLQSLRLWEKQGPSPLLLPPLCHIGCVTVARQDYRTGYRAIRRALAAGTARGYQTELAHARVLFCIYGLPWHQPIEETVRQAHWAREGLLRGGELQFASFTFVASSGVLLDCTPTLDGFETELEEGGALAQRTRNGFVLTTLLTWRQLLRSLRGETASPGSFDGPDFDEASHLAALEGNPAATAGFHTHRAVASAIFGDADSLARYTALALALVACNEGNYATAHVHFLNALSLARQAREAADAERGGLLARLEVSREWLALRAADAPANFLHLLRLVDAEKAWAAGDFRAALHSFDQALGMADPCTRRWHRALIAERAALFHLEHGLEQGARGLLAQARGLYRQWGATGKVRQLEKAHAFLHASRGKAPEAEGETVSGDTVDLLAVLRASQALSSETGLDRLRAQVVEVLQALTGATSVALVVRLDRDQQWTLLPQPRGEELPAPLPLEEAASRRLLPLAVFRYLERTLEPLLLDDPKEDDRFRHDPYLAPLGQCSLLGVPIVSHGALSAVLLLENSLSRGAFSAERLDAVTLIARQLAVSLENALLYQKLEERVRERTSELEETQHELVAAARQAGMAEIATNVLHNVGNVLNSVNISAGLVAAQVRRSKVPGLVMAVALLNEHAARLGEYLTEDEKGRLLPEYLEKVARALAEERKLMGEELSRLSRSVDHIKEVVATQQSYAGAGSLIEEVELRELIEDAVRINLGSLVRHEVAVERDFSGVATLPLDKARVLQILVNLISNARQAMQGAPVASRRLTISVDAASARLRIRVTDRGEGITAENLKKIFTHGFTTRKGGHGFGLHSCAVAAREMGGSLTVESAGPGRGASFTLELPVKGAGETL